MPRWIQITIVIALITVSGCFGSGLGIGDPTPTSTPTNEASQVQSENESIEYVIRSGYLPAELEHVNVTFEVVFVEKEGDMDPCLRDTYRGPYKPKITALALPSGECRHTERVTVDLTDIDGNYSLGKFAPDAPYSGGHALVISKIAATYKNGSEVRGIKGAGGIRANVEEDPPKDKYIMEVWVESYEDRSYLYWIKAAVIKSKNFSK